MSAQAKPILSANAILISFGRQGVDPLLLEPTLPCPMIEPPTVTERQNGKATMTDRNRATTLRLRTPTRPVVPGADGAPTAPRSPSAGTRPGLESRRSNLQTYIPAQRRADPTSQAILAELAALGLADLDPTD